MKLMLCLLPLLASCSLSLNNVNTRGTASDVVSSTPSNEVTANPTVDIPISALPAKAVPDLVPTSHTVHTETHTVHEARPVPKPIKVTGIKTGTMIPIQPVTPTKTVTVERIPVYAECPKP